MINQKQNPKVFEDNPFLIDRDSSNECLTKTLTALCFFFLIPFLSGCDSSKSTLKGKREPLLSQDVSSGSQSHPRSASLSLPPLKGILNRHWSVGGGTVTHALPVLEVSSHPKILWTKTLGEGASSHPLIANLVGQDNILVGMDGYGSVVAMDAQTGQVRWSVPTSVPEEKDKTLGGGIALGDSCVVVTTCFGEVLCLDLKTGKMVWHRSFDTDFRIAPVVSGATVFALSANNQLYALQLNTGKTLWVRSGNPESATLLGGGGVALDRGMVVVPYSSGQVQGLKRSDGQIVWEEVISGPLGDDSLANIAHIRARPVIANGIIYVISHAKQVEALSLETGAVLWRQDIGGIRTPALLGHFLYMVNLEGQLVALNRRNGDIQWVKPLHPTQPGETETWAGPLMTSQGLLLLGSRGQMAFYSPATGERITFLDTSQSFSLSPIVLNGIIYTLNSEGTLTAWK